MKKYEIIITRFYFDRKSPRFHRYVNAETESEAKTIAESEMIPKIARDNNDSGWEDFYRVESIKEV